MDRKNREERRRKKKRYMQREDRVRPMLKLIRHSVTMYIDDWESYFLAFDIICCEFLMQLLSNHISISIPRKNKTPGVRIYMVLCQNQDGNTRTEANGSPMMLLGKVATLWALLAGILVSWCPTLACCMLIKISKGAL
jgi:hypothetical protein